MVPVINPAHIAGLFVGLATVDVTYEVPMVPDRNEKAAALSQAVSCGGPAATAAVTHAFLGGRTRLVTAVGKHAVGELIRADLAEREVELVDLASGNEGPPPVSAIMVVPGGDRTVVSAVSRVFGDLSLTPAPELLDDVSVVLVDGHYMSACIAVAKGARVRSIPVVLDAGSWKDGLDILLESVTVAICSEDFRPPGCVGSDDVFDFLRRSGVKQAAITRGARPVLFHDGERRGEIPVPQVEANDTTGAGDVFHGAFCFAYPDRGFQQSLEFAAEAASFSCKYAGRTWMKPCSSSQARVRQDTERASGNSYHSHKPKLGLDS
jgi:sugar/nucleoside kinase (ribokinase family)